MSAALAARDARVTYANGRHRRWDVTWPLARLNRGIRWIHIGKHPGGDDASLPPPTQESAALVGLFAFETFGLGEAS